MLSSQVLPRAAVGSYLSLNSSASRWPLAHWFARRNPPRPGDRAAVYDLGGGTFDTTLLRAQPDGGFEEVASAGIDPLGGFDFDQALFIISASATSTPPTRGCGPLWRTPRPTTPMRCGSDASCVIGPDC